MTLVLLIRAYQAIVRPFLVGACKFHPTCSEYALEALQANGVWRGLKLTIGRVSRCHPFSPGGYDPVPVAQERPRDSSADSSQAASVRVR